MRSLNCRRYFLQPHCGGGYRVNYQIEIVVILTIIACPQTG